MCSGTVNRIWGMQTTADQKKILDKFLSNVNCPPDSTPEQILDFLQDLDVQKIEDQLIHFVLKLAPKPVETFCDDPNSLVPVEKKPILVGALTEEGYNLVDMFFPGAEDKLHMTW